MQVLVKVKSTFKSNNTKKVSFFIFLRVVHNVSSLVLSCSRKLRFDVPFDFCQKTIPYNSHNLEIVATRNCRCRFYRELIIICQNEHSRDFLGISRYPGFLSTLLILKRKK